MPRLPKGMIGMAHTLKTRRISPETKGTDGVAPAGFATSADGPPRPARTRDAPHPALARIARLLAWQAARDDRRHELGFATLELIPFLFVITLLLMALMAAARHVAGH